MSGYTCRHGIGADLYCLECGTEFARVVAALPTTAAERKGIPVYSGFIKYFPRAIAAVAELSRKGNDQHNPGKPLHWDRSKSGDELDAMCRHMLDDAAGVPVDTDDVLHATKMAWRAMANLEKTLEAREARTVNHPAGENGA